MLIWLQNRDQLVFAVPQLGPCSTKGIQSAHIHVKYSLNLKDETVSGKKGCIFENVGRNC
jgi:hypothetical protein